MHMRSVLLVLLIGLLAGCVSRPLPPLESDSSPRGSVRAVEPVDTVVETDIVPETDDPRDLVVGIGASIRGRTLQARLLGRGEDIVLLLATIHGNEAAGTDLLRSLAEHLLDHPDLLEGKTVILVEDANPDGHASNTRGNAHGVDLNRNFPAANFSTRSRGGPDPLSEPESRALHDLILRHRPARVVSIHQPLRLLDHDGPAEGLARRMAARCDLPVKKLGGRPGSMGSWVGIDLGIPIVTVELPRSADRLSPVAKWDRWGRMLLVAIDPEDDRR